MDRASVYLIESGFPRELPGFSQELSGACFPFWANYLGLDFALANFRHLAPEGCRVVLESRFRALAGQLPSRNGGAGKPLVLEGTPEEALRELTAVLERDPAETVVLAPLWLVCVIEREGLSRIAPRTRDPIIKLSLENAAVDVYAAQRARLVKLLRSQAGLPAGRAARSPAAEESLARRLFGRVLHESFDNLKDCPGVLLFQNNLMQLYRGNLWIAESTGTAGLAARLEHLGEPRGAGREVRIERNGSVRNSFLGAGSVVDGTVEGSVIFPDVVVGREAVVHNCVVMSGNRVAPRAQLYKSLVLPFTAEAPKNSFNIGEGCAVGQKHSAATNFEHSAQIREGLTVLGVNVEIPRGFSVSAGCLLEAGVGARQLRGLKEVRKGASVAWNTDP